MSTSARWRRLTLHIAVPAVTAIAAVTGIVDLTGSAAGSTSTATTAASLAHLSTTVLRGDVLPGLAKATNVGATRPATPVLVGLVLANPRAGAEQRLLHDLYTKGSPAYHHFLTPAQYQARFAVPASTYRTVKAWATREGLKVAHTSPMRDYLSVSGTAAQAQRTFAVTLNTYRQGKQRFFANRDAPTIPAGLGVTGVIGLNSKLRMHLPSTTPARTRAGLTSGPAPATVRPQQDGCTASVCTGLTTPQDLWSVYDLPTDNYGEGQSMAIFGEGAVDPVVANLRTFESVHKLPEVPISVERTDGNADYSDDSGEVEWDMDTQASTGMSPNVLGEKLYFGKDLSDSSVAGVFDAWANDPNGPLQASASYGECEENPFGNAAAGTPAAFSAGVQFTEAAEAALKQAVAEGRTLFASTGDTGSSCPIVPADVNGAGNEAYPVVNYPASSPEVVAVGGTVLYTDGTGASQTGETPSGAKRVDEYSWNYTGGGSSITFPQPAYQKNNSAPSPALDCVQNPDGTTASPGTVCRGIPDIAAQSGDVASNGYAIVSQGETAYPGGGTSLSSPLSLGMWTRIQAAAPAKVVGGVTTYPGNGFANDTYYPDYKSHVTDFFDVGGGTNSQPNSNGYYTSGPGDDYLSGLGIPDVKAIATHVDGGTAPAHNVLPTYPKSTSPYRYCTTPEIPLFTDPAGDDAYIGDPNGSGSNPQLDILSGDMTSSATTLTTTLTIADLTKNEAQAAGAANIYYFLWTYKGTQYFTEAQVDTTTGTVTYDDGTVSGSQYNANGSTKVTGQFNQGKPGTVVVTAPLSELGSPAKGSDLQAPAGQTRVLAGTTQTGGLIEQADVGGPQYDYQLGEACDPNATSPTPIPVTTTSNTYSFSGSATASSTATPTPTSSSPSTVPTTSSGSPRPTSSSPSPKPTKHGDHRRPWVKVSRWMHSHGRIIRVVRFGDTGTGVTRIAHVRPQRCRWNYGKHHTARSHHFRKPVHSGTFRVTSGSRHAWFSYTLYDKAGNHFHGRFRL